MSFVYPTLIVTNEIQVNHQQIIDDDPLLSTRRSSLPISSSQGPTTSSVMNDSSTKFRLRLHVDGFHAEDLNLHIDPGRIIVRGRHLLRCGNDNDPDGDFVCKEFKRTFLLPINLDIHKAYAQFYPEEEILHIEIPFLNLPMRAIDVFFTIITILFMDRALRITYEQYLHFNRY